MGQKRPFCSSGLEQGFPFAIIDLTHLVPMFQCFRRREGFGRKNAKGREAERCKIRKHKKKTQKGIVLQFCWNIGTFHYFFPSLSIYIYIYLLLFNNLQNQTPYTPYTFLVPLNWNTAGTRGTPWPHELNSQIKALRYYVICDIIRFRQGVVCCFLISSSHPADSFFNNLVSGVFYASVP